MTEGIQSEQDTVQKQPVEGKIVSNQEKLLHQKKENKNSQLALVTGSLLLLTLSLITFSLIIRLLSSR